MGASRWSDRDWDVYASVNIRSKSSVDAIYTSRHMDPLLDPKNIRFRESCDSAANPNSSPIILALDVTGSMGCVLDSMARGLGTLASEIYSRKPVPDPHIALMGIGDAECDMAPLQVTQFEADIRIAQQLTKIYFEKGGGGNSCESYTLAWYFAAMHTRIDSLSKRGKKGFLFTMGDEEPNPFIKAADIERFLGYKPQFDKLSASELLSMVSRQYEVFHIIVEEGSHFRYNGDEVLRKWNKLLGQRAIRLSDHTKLSEVIVSTLQVANGADKHAVISSWDDSSTSVAVANAIRSLDINKSSGRFIRF